MTRAIDRRRLLASAAATSAACLAPGLATAETGSGGPPVARIAPVTETLFGTPVTDRYRWMEAEGPEWQAYVKGQGAYARRVLDAIPGRDGLTAAVAGYTGEVVAVALRPGGRRARSSPRSVRPAPIPSSFMSADGMHGADRLLIDPDTYAGRARTPRWTGGRLRPTGATWCSEPHQEGRKTPPPASWSRRRGRSCPRPSTGPTSPRRAGSRTGRRSSTTACSPESPATAWTRRSSAPAGSTG